MQRLLLAALLAAAPLASLAQTSAVPTRISYQGRVTDASGTPVGNSSPVNRVVTFRIWSDPNSVSAANRLYSEQQTVTIANGEFSVLIGAGGAVSGETNAGTLDAVFNGEARYLGITIDDPAVATDPEISPRQQIVSNAYTFRAKLAEGLTNQSLTGTMIANNAVGTAQVADSAITFGKIAANAIDTTKLADNAVTAADIAAGAVTAAKLGADVGLWSVNGSTIFRATPAEVGIGTNTTAGAPLGVFAGGTNGNPRAGFFTAGSGVAGTRGLYVGLNNGGPAYLFNWENSPLDFGTNGVIRQRIEADGRFGFGVLNGDTNLDFYFKGVKAYLMKVQNAAGAECFTVRDYASIGIGQPNPTVQVHATALPGVGASQALFQLSGDAAANKGLFVGTNGSAAFVWETADRFLDFGTNGLNRLRIERDGRMGFNNLNGDPFISFLFKQVNADANGNNVILKVVDRNNAEMAAFTTYGSFKPGGGSWAATSDARLKTDVRNLGGSLDRLLQLRSVNFHYKDEARYGRGEQTGFIAQEMEKVFPQWVTTGPDGMKAISFSGFESHTVQALRELRAEKDEGFKARDAKIAALEARIRELETRESAVTDRMAAIERRLNSLSVAAARE